VLGLAVLLMLAVSVIGCGKKGPPVAPERRLPAAPSGLAASIEGPAIVVRWTNPKHRLDNTPLRDLTTVKLHRREDSADAAEPKAAMLSWGRVVGYDEIASISLANPAPAQIQGGGVMWTDTAPLRLGRRYVYVVTAIDGTGRSSPPSERLPVVFVAAPSPPRDPAAVAGDSQVRLAWKASETFTDGTPVTEDLRYLVLRGVGTDGPLAPITATPVTTTSFTDTGVTNDTTYRYAIRAMRVEPGRPPATGAASTTVTATPVDTTPPSPPSALVAIPSASAVRLAWNASPDADVALYAVYRATGDGPLTRIGTTAALNTVFLDSNVRSGTTYRYAVTALDRARTPNESARSNEATVTVP